MSWDKNGLIGLEREKNNDKRVYKASDSQCNCSPPTDWCPASP